jgi:DNA-binding transcriptional MerR regulator
MCATVMNPSGRCLISRMASSPLLIGGLPHRPPHRSNDPVVRRHRTAEKPSRRTSGYRTNSPTTIDELLFSKKTQTLSLTLDKITQILELTLSRKHLGTIDERIRHLRRFRTYPESRARGCVSSFRTPTQARTRRFTADAHETAVLFEIDQERAELAGTSPARGISMRPTTLPSRRE